MPKQTQISEYISNIPPPPYRPPTQSRNPSGESGPYRDIYYGDNESCRIMTSAARESGDLCYQWCISPKGMPEDDDGYIRDGWRRFDADGPDYTTGCNGNPDCLENRKGNCSCGNIMPCPSKLARNNGYIATACKILCCMDKCKAGGMPQGNPYKL